MRAVQVVHRFAPCLGGVETHVMQLCRHLLKQGSMARVVCLDRCPNSSKRLPSEESVAGVPVKRLGFLDLRFYRVAPGVLQAVKGADLVHVHGLGFFSDFLALTKFLHGKRLVLSTHGAVFHTSALGMLKKAYFFLWCRLVLRAFDRVVAVSRPDYELFRKIVPEKKIVLIDNPVDTEKLGALARNAESNSFLFVGRLSRNKGLHELLKAFAIVKRKRGDFRLRIVGKEFDLSEEELKKEASGLGLSGNVEILGEVSEKGLMDAYTVSGVFVSASQYEGFGISAVEAMAAGLVPILNKIPTFCYFVKSGETGFLVDFSDSSRAAKAILNAMELGSGERQKMGKKARGSAQRFSWKERAQEFVQVYRSVLE